MYNSKSQLQRKAGLFAFTIVLCLCFSTVLTAQGNCSYFASPDGGGDGSSTSSPFQIANFWKLAQPGDTLCLLDGVYTGSSSMISPPYFLSGTPQNRITITAINDGSVLIDGQGGAVPIYLANNAYLTIQGMNARNSSADVVLLYEGAHHNIIRRVVAWNAADSNSYIFSVAGANNTGNLLEDIGAFGVARKSIGTTMGAVGTIIRRAWAMWNYSTSPAGPKMTYTISYDSYNAICENCIGTIDEDIAPDDGDRFGIFSMDRMTTSRSSANARYLGGIAYVLGSQRASATPYGLLFGTRGFDYVDFENSVVYIEPGTHKDLRPVYGMGFDTGSASGGNRIMNGITAIGGAPSAIDQSVPNGWTIANVKEGADVADVYGNQSLWENDGTKGATVCYQYQNGNLTSIPLWPWPMNSRIYDATHLAGRAPTDVTGTMESIFGSIPANCGGSGSNISSENLQGNAPQAAALAPVEEVAPAEVWAPVEETVVTD